MMYYNSIGLSLFKNSFLEKKQPFKSDLGKSLEKITNHVKQKEWNHQQIEQENFQKIKSETLFTMEQQKFMQSVEDIEKVDDKTTLKEFIAMLCSASRTADNYCMELEQFKDTLQEYDKEIKAYEDMINDPEKLKEGLTISSAMDYLDQIKQKREEYIKEKGNTLQQRSEFHSALLQGIGGNFISQQQLDEMIFQKDARDMTKEIERVSKGITSIKDSITNMLKNLMEKLKQKGVDVDFSFYNQHGQKNAIPLWQIQKEWIL